MPQTTVGPPVNSHSVVFLCGTREGVTDGFIDQARIWVKAIVDGVVAARGKNPAPYCIKGDLGSDVAAAAQRVVNESSLARNAIAGKDNEMKVADRCLQERLGRLRGHTLVLLTHGLEPHEGDPYHYRHGILLANRQAERGGDVLLKWIHLRCMMVSGAHVVKNEAMIAAYRKKAALGIEFTTPELDQILTELPNCVLLVDAIRQSVFERVYLLACALCANVTETDRRGRDF